MHVQIGSNTIVERDGKILLVRLNYGPRDGRWALPGGLVEADETAEQAAIRETREETGFTVGLDGLLATWMRPGFPILVVIYRAHVLSGTLAGGEALSNRALAVDVSLGKGHIVMFALRPFWRWQTQGTYFLAFNAILNWDHLDAGK